MNQQPAGACPVSSVPAVPAGDARRFVELAAAEPVVAVFRTVPRKGRDTVVLYPAVAAAGSGGLIWEVADAAGSDARHGRHALLAADPVAVLTWRGGTLRRNGSAQSDTGAVTGRSVLAALRSDLPVARAVPANGGEPSMVDAVPPVGAFAVLGFDALAGEAAGEVADDVGDDLADDVPDAVVVFPRTVVVLDRAADQLVLMELVYLDGAGVGERRISELREAYAVAVDRLDALRRRLDEVAAADRTTPERSNGTHPEPHVDLSDSVFAELVTAAQARVRAGEVDQVTVSREFTVPVKAGPLALYGELRAGNPAPYLYLLDLPEATVVGASPQRMVAVSGGTVLTNALAGSRRRGADRSDDDDLAGQLMTDAKELAEHQMLVDLAIQELGDICKPGTVTADAGPRIVRYAAIMHLVTDVTGELGEGKDRLDALLATCPAGTVSGTPRRAAIRLIRRLERRRRGLYGGAVGLFGFDGSLDTCIGIRMLRVDGGTAHCRAGAGVVSASLPELEAEESRLKASALLRTAGSAR